jgi:predicted Zn-dependent protease with MMP-like domain
MWCEDVGVEVPSCTMTPWVSTPGPLASVALSRAAAVRRPYSRTRHDPTASSSMTHPPRHPHRSRRDRHGRGLRGRLVPDGVPLARSRAEQFDDLVLDAVEDLERRWERELAGVEFAVEDVPWVEHTSPEEVVLDADVLDDDSVPLARVLPAHRENGREVPPRIIVYRRPLEIRAHDRDDLADLVRDVVVDQVAVLLGRDPEEIDPTG